MHALTPFIFLAACPVVLATAVSYGNGTQNAMHSWAGSNLYFLHAIPLEQQSLYVSTLASWGVDVLRLWGMAMTPRLLQVFTDAAY